MYAIIETGGKQYKVQEGDVITVELLHAEAGETVNIDKVLMVNKDGQLTVGAPYVAGAKVELKVEENGKAPKIVVFKYKAKKNSRRKKGHRQPFTKATVVHHGLRQLNKVKYPTNQEEYRLLIDSSNKF